MTGTQAEYLERRTMGVVRDLGSSGESVSVFSILSYLLSIDRDDFCLSDVQCMCHELVLRGLLIDLTQSAPETDLPREMEVGLPLLDLIGVQVVD